MKKECFTVGWSLMTRKREWGIKNPSLPDSYAKNKNIHAHATLRADSRLALGHERKRARRSPVRGIEHRSHETST